MYYLNKCFYLSSYFQCQLKKKKSQKQKQKKTASMGILEVLQNRSFQIQSFPVWYIFKNVQTKLFFY